MSVPLHCETGFGEGLVALVGQALHQKNGLKVGLKGEARLETPGDLHLEELGAP